MGTRLEARRWEVNVSGRSGGTYPNETCLQWKDVSQVPLGTVGVRTSPGGVYLTLLISTEVGMGS